eukprot:2989150-Prymnesium_polylepis.2
MSPNKVCRSRAGPWTAARSSRSRSAAAALSGVSSKVRATGYGQWSSPHWSGLERDGARLARSRPG